MKFTRERVNGDARRSASEVRKQSKVYTRFRTGFGMYTPYSEVELDLSYKNQVLNPFAQMLLKVNPQAMVLDIGAGLGEASQHLERVGVAHAVRLDVNADALSHQPRAVVAPAWDLPFKDGAFTGIHMKDCITHVPPKFREQLFSEMKRVLEPGGRALMVGKESGILVEPFQYGVSVKKLAAQSAGRGLKATICNKWWPRNTWGDWYTGADQRRFVLLLENETPKEGEIFNSDIVNQ